MTLCIASNYVGDKLITHQLVTHYLTLPAGRLALNVAAAASRRVATVVGCCARPRRPLGALPLALNALDLLLLLDALELPDALLLDATSLRLQLLQTIPTRQKNVCVWCKIYQYLLGGAQV